MGTFGTTEIIIDNGQPMPGELNIEYQIIDVTSSTVIKPAMSWELIDDQIEPERVSDTGQKSIPGRMMWEARVQPERQITGKVTVRIATGDKTLFGVAEARTDAWSTGLNPVAFTTRLYGISPLGERRGVTR
jgi:hypothetical protein